MSSGGHSWHKKDWLTAAALAAAAAAGGYAIAGPSAAAGAGAGAAGDIAGGAGIGGGLAGLFGPTAAESAALGASTPAASVPFVTEGLAAGMPYASGTLGTVPGMTGVAGAFGPTAAQAGLLSQASAASPELGLPGLSGAAGPSPSILAKLQGLLGNKGTPGLLMKGATLAQAMSPGGGQPDQMVNLQRPSAGTPSPIAPPYGGGTPGIPGAPSMAYGGGGDMSSMLAGMTPEQRRQLLALLQGGYYG